eukprot:TRINITY_DN102222_c0_g1_i1.p1 TRINITY_DN102222_c0_g1~~TRINITY_DN102222_c0_g1_i1.p1  ORF type:complete len:690 (+),score=84.51 TRINITY_DN102222_c0_g1_i1:54-2123(+)
MAAGIGAEFEVCIVGLGVSSVPLIKELEQSGVGYCVVTSTAFGIWKKLHDAGENFDLVTTIESTNYSWWSYDYDFPFYTAKDYYAKLQAELDDAILSKVIFKDIVYIRQDGDMFQIMGKDDELLASSSKLVHSIGFSPDQNIFSTLAKISSAETGGSKHFLVSGLSDTTNMYISRLVHAGHRVTVMCEHFHVLDKIGTIHGNAGGPFDQYEPMQHWSGSSAAPNITGILVPLPIGGAKVGSPSWVIGKVQSYVASLVGLSEVIDLRKFDSVSQVKAQSLVNPTQIEVPGGLGYLVKQWPADEYAKYYNDPKYREWMLKEHILLNDIYFFIQQGLVKVHKRCEVVHLAGKRYSVAGEELEFDDVLGCSEASHKLLEIRGCKPYAYLDYLHGVWNRSYPNLFYLGTTRPYTGAFGCVSEMNALFVHRMITDRSFCTEMTKQFPSLMHGQRILNYSSVSEPDKLHVQWAGMHCLRIARALGCDLSYGEAKKRGLVLEWMTGPITPLRCRITGPYAVPDAAERYKRSCQKIHTNFMAINMIYRIYGDCLVVASWFMAAVLCYGYTWDLMTDLEKALFIVVSWRLATRQCLLSQLHGLVMMCAFDNLYHKRAWFMLFFNACQFLLNFVCVLKGTDFGIPIVVRLGVPVDVFFLILGYFCFPRAFFGDMRVRRPYADWLFKIYLAHTTGPSVNAK